jgi:hypothetical protein
MTAGNVAQNSRAKTVNVECSVEDQVYTLYTCPSNCRAHMSLLYTANGDNAAVNVDIEWERADTTHAHILSSKNLGVGEFIQWSGAFIVLEPGDSVTVTASSNTTPHLDAFATVEEFFSLP